MSNLARKQTADNLRGRAGILAEAEAAALSGSALRLAPSRVKAALAPHFDANEIESVVAPHRTLQRRVARGEALTEDESDRAVRLARIADHAERVFGDSDKAGRWLRKPVPALHGRTPVELLQTETGARKVEDELIRIDHGIFG
ncbi:MAG: DUF2384 domain-containing protein [Methylobacteriaceae bacterium]|nr:DUF2384 domain-containing protein [Rhodoblastus sp.]MCC0005956.1 DUF2384 domain-containing protein [Methylobacteriaceae bacterium]